MPYYAMVFVLVALGCVGLLLLVRGIRGVVIGSSPHCPRCHHDLSGLTLPGACPECGRSTELGVRIGSRRRSLRAAVAGAFLLLPVLLGGVVVARNIRVLPWLPTSWLLHVQSQHGSAGDRSDAFAELAQRVRDGKLSKAEGATLVRLILSEQSSSASWIVQGSSSPTWPIGASEAMLEAFRKGLATDDELGAFLLYASDFSVTFSPTLEPGELRPAIVITSPRGLPQGVSSSGPSFGVFAGFESLRIGEEKVELRAKHYCVPSIGTALTGGLNRLSLRPRPGELPVDGVIRVTRGASTRDVPVHTKVTLRQTASTLDVASIRQMAIAGISGFRANRAQGIVTASFRFAAFGLAVAQSPTLRGKGGRLRSTSSQVMRTGSAAEEWTVTWNVDSADEPLTFDFHALRVEPPGMGAGEDLFWGDLDIAPITFVVDPKTQRGNATNDGPPPVAPASSLHSD
jgi:hypothetical protein